MSCIYKGFYRTILNHTPDPKFSNLSFHIFKTLTWLSWKSDSHLEHRLLVLTTAEHNLYYTHIQYKLDNTDKKKKIIIIAMFVFSL